MKKLKNGFQIFFIMMAVKAAILISIFITPFLWLLGISLIIWFTIELCKDVEPDEDDNEPKKPP